jgi:hypothetical protein
VSPVRYDLGFYIPGDDILRAHNFLISFIVVMCSPDVLYRS